MARKTEAPLNIAGLSGSQLEEYAARSGGRIQAQISSFENGLQIFRNISIVRIKSDRVNLLILEDYMPILGEIDGDVDLIGRTEFYSLKGVKGFFCHEHNVFFLLLKESADVG